MNVFFYHTYNTFEFLPTIILCRCESEKLQKCTYNLLFGWGTLVLELALETKF